MHAGILVEWDGDKIELRNIEDDKLSVLRLVGWILFKKRLLGALRELTPRIHPFQRQYVKEAKNLVKGGITKKK